MIITTSETQTEVRRFPSKEEGWRADGPRIWEPARLTGAAGLAQSHQSKDGPYDDRGIPGWCSKCGVTPATAAMLRS